MTKIRSVYNETTIISAVLPSYFQENNSTALTVFFFSAEILFNDQEVSVFQRLDAWPNLYLYLSSHAQQRTLVTQLS